MKILVTGGSGFLGKEIVRQLLHGGHEVYSLQRKFSIELEKLDVVQFLIDASDSYSVSIFNKNKIIFDAVIHTAAKAGVWGNYIEYEKANVDATINLVNYAKNHGVKYFIYTSTPSVVYGDKSLENIDENCPYPAKFLTSYAMTKAIAESYVLKSHQVNFQTIAIRPHLIFGKGDPHLLPRILEKAKNNKLFKIGNGQNLVDVIHVKNAAYAHLCALDFLIESNAHGGKAYFVAQERPVPLWWFIDQILKLFRLRPIPIYKTFSLVTGQRLGRMFEIVYKLFGIKSEPPLTQFVALQLGTSHYFNQSAAINDLSYRPLINIEDGLKEIVEV